MKNPVLAILGIGKATGNLLKEVLDRHASSTKEEGSSLSDSYRAVGKAVFEASKYLGIDLALSIRKKIDLNKQEEISR